MIALTSSSLSANVVAACALSMIKLANKLTSCQICSLKGHRTLNCFNIYDNKLPSTNAKALASVPKSALANLNICCFNIYDRNVMWYLDLGVTHHIKDDVNNIQKQKNYNGTTSIFTANGEKKKISHIGALVPSATKNLLSVKKLCDDNAIIIELVSKV